MHSHEPIMMLTRTEAASRAGISEGRLNQLRRMKKFPEPALLGPLRVDGLATSVRWSSADVDAWRRTREVPTALNTLLAEPTGAHLRGPVFRRVADAEAAARSMSAYAARVAVEGPREFVLWLPARDEERNARTLTFLARSFPGLRFELVDGHLL